MPQLGPGGFLGPTLPRTAGAAHHLTADSHGRCDPNLQRTSRPGAALQKSQSQQTSEGLHTGGERKQHGGAGGDEADK